MTIIETIKTTYAELFKVSFVHPLYDQIYTYKEPVTNNQKNITISSILNDLFIEPDTNTKTLFVDHFIGLRFSNNFFQCFIRCKRTDVPANDPPFIEKPFIELASDTRLRFLLKVKSDFINKTKIIVAGNQEVYLFSNRDNNGTGGLISQNAEVNDDDLEAVFVAEPEKNCVGIIDIYTSGTSDDYRLLGDSGEILGRKYKIQFKKN